MVVHSCVTMIRMVMLSAPVNLVFNCRMMGNLVLVRLNLMKKKLGFLSVKMSYFIRANVPYMCLITSECANINRLLLLDCINLYCYIIFHNNLIKLKFSRKQRMFTVLLKDVEKFSYLTSFNNAANIHFYLHVS